MKSTNSDRELDIKFYDTVVENQHFMGKIRYRLNLDTIKTSDINSRSILVYASTDKNLKATDIINDKNIVWIDSVDGVFPFRVVFSESGENALKLAIKDYIYLKIDITDEFVKEIILPSYITDSIYVLDKDSVIGKGNSIYVIKSKRITIKRKDSARIVREAQQEIDSLKRVLNN